MDQPSMNN